MPAAVCPQVFSELLPAPELELGGFKVQLCHLGVIFLIVAVKLCVVAFMRLYCAVAVFFKLVGVYVPVALSFGKTLIVIIGEGE